MILNRGKFSEPVRIGPKSTDHHYSPIIWADEEDFLHVLYGCHLTPGTHLVSIKPITAGSDRCHMEGGPQDCTKHIVSDSLSHLR
jgi:hypothetical protein